MTKGELRTRQTLYLFGLLLMIGVGMFVFPIIRPGMSLIETWVWIALIWFPMMMILRKQFPEDKKSQPPFDDDAKFTG